MRVWPRRRLWQVIASLTCLAALVAAVVLVRIISTVRDPAAVLHEDTLINADLWDTEPRMMAAGLGFTQIIGVPGLSPEDPETSATLVHLAGGAWNDVTCADGSTPSLYAYTSAATPEGIETSYGNPTYYADGLPIEFSWPVLPSSLDADDIAVTLNNGSVIQPEAAAIWPNFEFNERSTVVVFGYFGNRLPAEDPGSIYPVRVDVVAGETPLQLVGPGPTLVSAVGMGVESPGSPYTKPDVAPEKRGGPKLVAAKLSRYSSEGDTGPKIFQAGLLPNDGEALYGDRAQYRLRVFTSGGMTPDGVTGMKPTEFSRFFRIVATTTSGEAIEVTNTGEDYVIDGAVLRVEGLADLGIRQDTYDDCYRDDKDNQIDIILSGDESAMRAVSRVQMPSTGEYDPVYNPGGPGNAPWPGVRYSAPSPPIDIEVLQALDDPMTVTYP